MQVSRRAALRVEGVFKNEETAAIGCGHLEVNGANAESAMLAEPIFACCDPQ
jgi:hypothetical protein